MAVAGTPVPPTPRPPYALPAGDVDDWEGNGWADPDTEILGIMTRADTQYPCSNCGLYREISGYHQRDQQEIDEGLHLEMFTGDANHQMIVTRLSTGWYLIYAVGTCPNYDLSIDGCGFVGNNN